ncbi:hypothetical protein Fmac_007030 [Flemingia macrophylla]|uniref:Uncharacterized protein n=1 Tax=Flemingia macrophylla TaxID=520843 RepID=A0ABD1NCA9_9FABA
MEKKKKIVDGSVWRKGVTYDDWESQFVLEEKGDRKVKGESGRRVLEWRPAIVERLEDPFVTDVFFARLCLFVFGIPLFIDTNEHSHHVKWNLWVVHELLLVVYGFVMFAYHSGCREAGNGATFGFW